MGSVELKFDVVVVGGGMAGVAAAVTAARHGKSVALIERDEVPGGAATQGVVGTLCGLAAQGSPSIVVEGIAAEVAEALLKRSGRKELTINRHGISFLPYSIDDLLWELYLLIDAEELLTFFNGTTVVGVMHEEENNARLSAVSVLTDGQLTTLIARSFIDCSGNAVVSSLAGVPVHRGARQQDALVVKLSGLPLLEEKVLSMYLFKELMVGREGREALKAIGTVSVVPDSVEKSEQSPTCAALIKLGAACPRTWELQSRSAQSSALRRAALSVVEYFSSIEDLKRVKLEWIAPRVGERSGAVGQGVEVLTESHVINGVKCHDEVARGYWPLEWWGGTSRRPEMKFLADNDYYSINSGMLRSADLENVFFAGRTISAEEKALASARVIGTSMSTGEAAARLASVVTTREKQVCQFV